MRHLSIVALFFLLLRHGVSDARTYSFDASLLNGGGKGVDLTLFEDGSQLPGVYTVDIILNDSRVDYREVTFHTARSDEGKTYLKSCLTKDMLTRYGVKTENYSNLFMSNNEQLCADLSVIPQATEIFKFAEQKLVITIPQEALRPRSTGIVSEELWDDGIPAFLLNWQASTSRISYNGHGRQFETESFQTTLEPGVNLGPWRVRNLTTWNKTSGEVGEWDSVYTRAERGLYKIKSRLSLGEDYTPSDIFDSVPFRGLKLGSDENMVPYNQREFAPIVRGIARTQAKIEVHQEGYLIYSLTVAPGPFELTDLPVTGSGGDLQVSVFESDGTTHTFTVPFATPAIALREGYLKYNISGGQYRPYDTAVENSSIGQFTIMYGLPWGLTAFGGMQVAENYQATGLGMGLSMGEWGAISLDGIRSHGKKKGYDSETGYTWRTRYNKSFELTGTNITAANYEYPSAKYQTLSDVLDTYRDAYFSSDNNRSNRNRRTTLSLSQSIGEMGNINIFGSRDEFHDGRYHQDSISLSYNAIWKDISWSLNWSRDLNTSGHNGFRERTEDSVSMWVSVPLSKWLGGERNNIQATAQMQRSTGQRTRYETGINGRAFDRRLYWDVRQQVVAGNNTDNNSSRISLSWDGTYGKLTGMYSSSTQLRQMNVGMSGGMIAHSNGITFGQKAGDTIALISAPGVNGASVKGRSGIKTDFRGYTLVGYVAPYQENVISLDPTTFHADVEVPQTDSRVVPTEGAVVTANFKTHVGSRALVTLIGTDGEPLPFGTVVTVENEPENYSSVGVVGENGKVYMSGLAKSGKLKAQWGRNSKCYANYRLAENEEQGGIFLSSSICMN